MFYGGFGLRMSDVDVSDQSYVDLWCDNWGIWIIWGIFMDPYNKTKLRKRFG